MERAVANGYMRATVKDYSRKRERWFDRALKREAPKQTGPNLSGWRQLATFASQKGRLVTGGERLVA